MLCIYLYGMEEGIQADIDGGRDRNKRADKTVNMSGAC